jgi:LPS-assembly protein
VLGGELSTNFHARALTRRDNQPRDGTDSSHVVAEVNWRRKLIDGIGQLWTPFASLRGDVYSFNDARDPNNLAIVQPNETVTRGNAVAGLQYAYPFVAHTQNASHTLTPIAQVIARPNRVDQRWLPDEDAKSLVWDDTLLFDIDKFSGYDRFETGTRVNYGAQYTFQANNGFNGRFVFGQSRQIAGENPYADPGKDVTAAPAAPGLTDPNNFTQFSGLETQRSDYVAGLYISPQQGLSLTAQGRFDERDLSLRRQDTVATLTAGPVLAQAIYTYSRADPALLIPEPQQELIGTLGLRLTTNWSVLGQLRYDLDASTRLQDVFQVKYSDECFVLTATYTETFINDPTRDIRPDRSLMLRFELKHLGEFNYKTDNLSNIFGHNQPFSAQ